MVTYRWRDRHRRRLQMVLNRAQEIVPIVRKVEALDSRIRLWHLSFGQSAEANGQQCLSCEPGGAGLKVDPGTLNGTRTEHEKDDGCLLELGPYALQPDLAGEDLPIVGGQEHPVRQRPLEMALEEFLDRLCYSLLLMYEADEDVRHLFTPSSQPLNARGQRPKGEQRPPR